jgi:hypothetical protein
MFLVEGSGFFDPKTWEFRGMDLWLWASLKFSASTLQKVYNLNCKTSGTDRQGRNCLFLSVLGSDNPSTSDQFKRLLFLLDVSGDIYAQDAKGYTIFDILEKTRPEDEDLGSYQSDLLYCVLERAGIDVSDHRTRHPRIAVYSGMGGWRAYTPEHYHAMKHLQSWDESNFRSQMDHLLQEIPLDEEESREMDRVREMERIQKMELYERWRTEQERYERRRTEHEAERESSGKQN